MSNVPLHVQLKNQGNTAFQKNKLSAAINLYTEAIATYFTNRALCHIKQGNFQDAIADGDSAIKLDSDSVKGNYFKGLGLEGQGKLEEAVIHMEKALDICNMGKTKTSESFVNDIRNTIKQTLKKVQLEAKYKKHKDLQDDWQEICGLARAAKLDDIDRNPLLTDQAKEEQRYDVAEEFEMRNTRWQEHFETISPMKASALEVPDFLQCKISMDICADPCVTPDGITYDRGVLEEHLKTNQFDPVTRSPLNANQLHPNLALKEAIQAYYTCNPWADDLELR